MSNFLELPWKKIRFKTESGGVYDGYVYLIMENRLYVSQNDSGETLGMCQNWVICKEQILNEYERISEIYPRG